MIRAKRCPLPVECEECPLLHDNCDGNEDYQEREAMRDERKLMDVDDSHYADD